MKLLLATNRKSVLVFFLLFSVMLLVVAITVWKTSQMSRAYSVERNRFDQLHEKNYRSIQDADYLVSNLTEFENLHERGVIGAVDRIVWVEAFEGVRQHMELADFYYEIGQPVSMSVNSDDGIAIQTVMIDLRIGFPHDEALFHFFSLLRDSVNVNYIVTDLEIERVNDAVSQQQNVSYPPVNLIAISRINWLSIVPASINSVAAVQGA